MADKPRYFTGRGGDVVDFGRDHIVQTKGRWAGTPLVNEPWQVDYLDELFLEDADGNLVYRESLLGVPRKNGKSTTAAEIALYMLLGMGEQGAEVYAAAASRDQARIVFNQAKEFVEASPTLLQYLKPQRNAILCPSINGVFRVLSSDAPLQYGLNPSAVVIDELWAHKNPELYYALTTGQLARANPLVVSITTAGWDRDSICWQVYEHGRALADQGLDAMREARFYFKWFAAPADALPDDREAWRTANPASWITEDLLQHEHDRLPEFVFRRLHLNQWTDTEDAWISPQEWDACKGTPKWDQDKPTWIALDVGIRRDARAIVWVQWDDETDTLHMGHEITVPSEHALSAGEARVRVQTHAALWPMLREVAYDPFAFRESAEMLAEEGLPMVQYDQTNANMAPASERIYELIREGRLVHDGNEELRKQILAAVVAETERGWRISKRKSQARIDAAVALTMAADRAILTRNDGDSSFFIY